MTIKLSDHTAGFLTRLLSANDPEVRSYVLAHVSTLTGVAEAALDKALKGFDSESRSVCEEYAFLWGAESTSSISDLHRRCVAVIDHRNEMYAPNDEPYMRVPTRKAFKAAISAMQLFRIFSGACNYRTEFNTDDIWNFGDLNPYERQIFKQWAKSHLKSSTAPTPSQSESEA